MKRKKWIISLSLLALLLIGAVAAGPIMSIVERPPHTIIYAEDNFEIRDYPALIVAEVTIEGPREDAIRTGFKQLAGYIFGSNTKQLRAKDKNNAEDVSQSIAMTAPVLQTPGAQEGVWTTRFVMPSSYTQETLPIPKNPQVKIQTQLPQRFVVINFSGSNTTDNIIEHEKKLKKYIEKKALQPIGPATYAFYNPPWTLPFFRHNEIMVPIENAHF